MNDFGVFTYVSIFIQLISLIIGIYHVLIGMFGFISLKEKKRETNKINTFALIVSAHNEEAVIANLIHSLKAIDYPDNSYDIFVVADNCTDQTAQIAENCGANVFIRTSDKRGKGYALEWIFEKLFDFEKKYDYIAVFDADNLSDKSFLKEMNIHANKGHKVIQGYVNSKNPFDSWITVSYSISFWTISRTFQLARYRLGLCCQLMGTGFAIETDTLKRIGWCPDCLTEDMEFTMKLALNDEKVSWAHKAKIYDEKPVTLINSWRQRKRWIQGHCDVASKYFVRLIKKGIKEKKLTPIDCAVYLIQPIRIITMGIIMFFGYAQTFHPSGDIGFVQLSYLFDSPVIWNTISVLNLLYMPVVVTIEQRKFNFKYLFGYFIYPLYNLTWIPIAIQGLTVKNKKDWYHTRHTRNISIDEIN